MLERERLIIPDGLLDRVLTKLHELLPRRESMPAATYKKRSESAANEIAWLANIAQTEVELVPAGTPRTMALREETIALREEKVLRKFAGSLKALASGLSFCDSAGSTNLLCSALTGSGLEPDAMRQELDGMYWSVLTACANHTYPAELSRQILMDALGWVYYDLTGEPPGRPKAGGFPAFARGMFEAMRIKTPLNHLIQKTCEFIKRELEARVGR
ncbi:MAG: hypothetical protein ACLP7P_05605 [Rhodomicrobium sp.]